MSFSVSAPIARALRAVFRLILDCHRKIREEDPDLNSLKDLKSFLNFAANVCPKTRLNELAFLRGLMSECEKLRCKSITTLINKLLEACHEEAISAWAISLFTPKETVVPPCLRRIEDWHEFTGLYTWLYRTKSVFLLYDKEHQRPVLFSISRDYVKNIETCALRNPGTGLSAKIRHLYEIVPFGRLIRKRFPSGKQVEIGYRRFKTINNFLKDASFASISAEGVLRALSGNIPLNMLYALVAPSSFRYTTYTKVPDVALPLVFEATLLKDYVTEGLLPFKVEERTINAEVPYDAWIGKVEGSATMLTLYYPLRHAMLLMAIGPPGLVLNDYSASIFRSGWPSVKEIRREALALTSVEVYDLEEAMKLAEHVKEFLKTQVKGKDSSARRKEAKRKTIEAIYVVNRPTATKAELREFRRRASEYRRGTGKTILRAVVEILLNEQGYIRIPRKRMLMIYSSSS